MSACLLCPNVRAIWHLDLLRSTPSLQCHLLHRPRRKASYWQLHPYLKTLKCTLVLMANTSLFTVSLISRQRLLQRATWEYFPSNCYHINSRCSSSKRRQTLVQVRKVQQVTGLITSRSKTKTRYKTNRVWNPLLLKCTQYSQCPRSVVPKFW